MINEILAKGIPALSPPAGHEPIELIELEYKSELDNLDMNNSKIRGNGWPRLHETWKRRWLHNDIRNMAFLYTYEVFNKIVETGGLK